jgi:hypothetical protein
MRQGPKLKEGRTNAPDPVSGEQYVMNLADPRVTEVWGRLGRKPKDYKLAQRVVTLMSKHPHATVPELVAMDWLNQQGIEYVYLAQIFGGHSRKGGAEVDLLFQYAGTGIAWQINGSYWHNRDEVAASDIIDRMKLLGATYHGIRIDKVCALWENRIYDDRPRIFDWGLQGIELGQ